MASPVRLDFHGSQNGAIWAFEAVARVGDGVLDLDLIGDAGCDLIRCVSIEL